MADGGVVEAALITAAVSTATTVYASQEAKANAPKAPVIPEAPKQPNVSSFAASQQQSEAAARTAGGTIKSDPEENRRQIGTAPTPPKTLLGS